VSDLYAFVDESERPGRYVMCALVAEATHLPQLRRIARGLLLPGQGRLHFHNESHRRQRELASRLVEVTDAEISVYICKSAHGRGPTEARACCVRAIVEDLQSREEAVTLFLESRAQQDREDHDVIRAARRRTPTLMYQHLPAAEDPLLWLPDAYAWLVGAGGQWRRRVEPVLAKVVEVP
jgi:hypothetical protein